MNRFHLLLALLLSPVLALAQMMTTMPPSYQGLWWRSPGGSESGWGLNITHQGNILFATWFTYDTNGRGLWLVAPSAMKTGTNTYSGTLYKTRGPAFDASPWDPAKVSV